MRAEQADFGIYPEGSRSKTGELQEFKSGAFYLAKKADAPIVVMAVWNTEKVGKKFPIRRTVVYHDYLGVLDRETVRSSSLDDLAAITRGMIEARLAQYGK